MGFRRVDSEEQWSGHFIAVRRESFEHDDGETVTREVVTHPGAVAIVCHDGERLYLVSQPREAAGEQALLELPAGKLDEEGEDAEATARRELAEEIGKGAREWRHLKTFYTTPGFSDEQCHIYLATDLYDEDAEADENERIEIETVPLERIDDAIERSADAKTLIGLLWFKAYEQGGRAAG